MISIDERKWHESYCKWLWVTWSWKIPEQSIGYSINHCYVYSQSFSSYCRLNIFPNHFIEIVKSLNWDDFDFWLISKYLVIILVNYIFRNLKIENFKFQRRNLISRFYYQKGLITDSFSSKFLTFKDTPVILKSQIPELWNPRPKPSESIPTRWPQIFKNFNFCNKSNLKIFKIFVFFLFLLRTSWIFSLELFG